MINDNKRKKKGRRIRRTRWNFSSFHHSFRFQLLILVIHFFFYFFFSFLLRGTHKKVIDDRIVSVSCDYLIILDYSFVQFARREDSIKVAKHFLSFFFSRIYIYICIIYVYKLVFLQKKYEEEDQYPCFYLRDEFQILLRETLENRYYF